MRRLILTVLSLVFGVSGALAGPVTGGYTDLTYSPGHGTQIEYVAKNGTNYLWYPGNKVILPGKWKTQGKNICFVYGPNTYNPVTGSVGAKWECMLITHHQASIVERVKGDPFNLARGGRPPFVLSKNRIEMAAIAKRLRVKITPADLPVGTPGSNLSGEIGLPMNITKATCEQVFANAEKSKANALLAARVIATGKWMGHQCMKPDVVRAFQIYEKYGVLKQQKGFLTALVQRASQGNLYAQSAVKRLKKAGYLD